MKDNRPYTEAGSVWTTTDEETGEGTGIVVPESTLARILRYGENMSEGQFCVDLEKYRGLFSQDEIAELEENERASQFGDTLFVDTSKFPRS